MERRQDVLVVRLRDVLLKHCEEISRGRNNDVHQYVSTTSETSLKLNTQRHLSGTYPRRPISTSLQRFM